MKKLSILLPLLILIILSCGKESPISTEEKSQRGTISGTVTDSTGKPISGVNATLSSPNGKVDLTGFTTVTDTAGNYTIPLVPAGLYNVTFTHAYYRDSVISNVEIAKAEDLARININLRPKRAKLSGTIVDQFGKPVYQAALLIKPWGLTTQTDSVGAFSIEGISLDSATIVVNKKNYAALSESYEFVPETLTVNRAYTVPELFGTVSGVVESESKPLAGAVVTLLPELYTDTTDSNGNYSFSNCQLDRSYSVSVTARNYVSQISNSFILTESHRTEKKDLALAVKKGSFEGILRDSKTNPLANVSIGGTTIVTDAEGRFLIPSLILDKHYDIHCSKLGYRSTDISFILTEESPNQSIDTLLYDSSAVISGFVKDSQGKAIAEVTVSCPSSGQTTQTDNVGNFTLDNISYGTFRLYYERDGFFPDSSQLITVGPTALTCFVIDTIVQK